LTCVEGLAEFVHASRFEDISSKAVEQLKIRVLDSLGCAIGALQSQPVKSIRKIESEFGGLPLCTLVGGAKTAPDRATLINGTLVRYLDFNDSFLSKAKHVTQATILLQFWLLQSMLVHRGGSFWLLWPWLIRFNAV